jgi:HEAT repeat protein
MSDKKNSRFPFEGDNKSEDALWDTLGELADAEPSPQLRQNFYRELEKASRPRLSERLRDLLGFSGNAGWITVAASVLVGLAAGQLLETPADDALRLAALEENVSMLNRSLILDRLENDTASKRLRGVMDAAYVVGDDAEIANALLLRATNDPVPSVRSAAIGALGTQLGTPAVGKRLMDLLQQSESPLVQLALVDLVLRNGSNRQIAQLEQLADDGLLHPDIARHVATTLKRDLV